MFGVVLIMVMVAFGIWTLLRMGESAANKADNWPGCAPRATEPTNVSSGRRLPTVEWSELDEAQLTRLLRENSD